MRSGLVATQGADTSPHSLRGGRPEDRELVGAVRERRVRRRHGLARGEHRGDGACRGIEERDQATTGGRGAFDRSDSRARGEEHVRDKLLCCAVETRRRGQTNVKFMLCCRTRQ